MKIYLTDLQAYNEGHLVGKWLTLPLTPFELSQALSEVLCEGEAISGTPDHEEYFITDYECDYLSNIDEYASIDKLNTIAESVSSYSEDDLLKLNYLSSEGYSETDVIAQGIDTYDVTIYDYSDDTGFTDVYELLAIDLVAEGCFGEIPTPLQHYIDYSAIGRDLAYDYAEFEPNILARVS